MYNDRHWLTAAGAGIGILCTKTAYWLYQNKNYFSKETKRQL
jgi:membrane-associated phospholipid phosphatase